MKISVQCSRFFLMKKIHNAVAGLIIVGASMAVPLSAGVPQASASTPHCNAAPTPGVNWSGCNRSHANLSAANLNRSNLSDANLFGANLVGANLSHANLSGADLDGVANWSTVGKQEARFNRNTRCPNGKKFGSGGNC